MGTDVNQEIMEAVNELRTSVESKSVDSAETKAKVEKIQLALDGFEDANQKASLAANQKTKEADELKERFDALEVELAHVNKGAKNVNYKESPQYKALVKFCQVGKEGVTPEEKALLRTDSDVSGGYLVDDPEFDNQITKKITEISNIRQVARVRTVGKKMFEMPVRNTIPVATYEGEADSNNESTSTYENETLMAFRQTFTTPITLDMLMDSNFNMESELMSDAGEAFAVGEGAGFVLGTGHKQPEGFLVNADVLAGSKDTAGSGTISADDMILLTGDLKTGYNPWYSLNRRTLAFLRTLKSTDGVFLWQPGMNGPVANTINGFPYLIANDMPDIAIGNKPVAFADFQKGYTIIDRTGISVVRDELTEASKAIIKFTFHRYNTGKVTLPEAFQLLNVKA